MADRHALDPDFVAHASLEAIRVQYERAQRMADLWDDRARALFLLLRQRTDDREPDADEAGTSRT